MVTGSPRTPLGSMTFRLGVLGVTQEARYAERLAVHGVKPKHVALLSALRLGATGSQQELAGALRIAPSLVVLLADQLEEVGAVERVRDTADRRRQRLLITDRGIELLDACVAVAAGLDRDIAGALTGAERDALARILRKLALAEGLPGDGD
jgi:DNA-binding MarR family transcriptional regulator